MRGLKGKGGHWIVVTARCARLKRSSFCSGLGWIWVRSLFIPRTKCALWLKWNTCATNTILLCDFFFGFGLSPSALLLLPRLLFSKAKCYILSAQPTSHTSAGPAVGLAKLGQHRHINFIPFAFAIKTDYHNCQKMNQRCKNIMSKPRTVYSFCF